jgi:hypothetical protein
VFVEIVTESKICHIYKAVLLIIKIVVHNVSRSRTQRTKKPRTQASKSNHQHNTAKLDVGLLLLERV